MDSERPEKSIQLQDLPNELYCYLLPYLVHNYTTLFVLGRLSKRWHQIISESELWLTCDLHIIVPKCYLSTLSIFSDGFVSDSVFLSSSEELPRCTHLTIVRQQNYLEQYYFQTVYTPDKMEQRKLLIMKVKRQLIDKVHRFYRLWEINFRGYHWLQWLSQKIQLVEQQLEKGKLILLVLFVIYQIGYWIVSFVYLSDPVTSITEGSIIPETTISSHHAFITNLSPLWMCYRILVIVLLGYSYLCKIYLQTFEQLASDLWLGSTHQCLKNAVLAYLLLGYLLPFLWSPYVYLFPQLTKLKLLPETEFFTTTMIILSCDLVDYYISTCVLFFDYIQPKFYQRIFASLLVIALAFQMTSFLLISIQYGSIYYGQFFITMFERMSDHFSFFWHFSAPTTTEGIDSSTAEIALTVVSRGREWSRFFIKGFYPLYMKWLIPMFVLQRLQSLQKITTLTYNRTFQENHIRQVYLKEVHQNEASDVINERKGIQEKFVSVSWIVNILLLLTLYRSFEDLPLVMSLVVEVITNACIWQLLRMIKEAIINRESIRMMDHHAHEEVTRFYSVCLVSKLTFFVLEAIIYQ